MAPGLPGTGVDIAPIIDNMCRLSSQNIGRGDGDSEVRNSTQPVYGCGQCVGMVISG